MPPKDPAFHALDPTLYMMWGDLDKPFHRPECACHECETWRAEKGRPTHGELRWRVMNQESEKNEETTL